MTKLIVIRDDEETVVDMPLQSFTVREARQAARLANFTHWGCRVYDPRSGIEYILHPKTYEKRVRHKPRLWE